MAKLLVLSMLLLLLLLVATGAGLAHQPEANLGSPDWRQPYDVPRPQVSRSIRGVVGPGQSDFYRFVLTAPQAITLWLLTPDAPGCRGFTPRLRVWAPGQNLQRWDGTTVYGATTRAWDDPDGWASLAAAPWGRFTHFSASNSGPSVKPQLPAGEYLVAVQAPAERGGSYTFAIGDLEIAGGGVPPALARAWDACPEAWPAF